MEAACDTAANGDTAGVVDCAGDIDTSSFPGLSRYREETSDRLVTCPGTLDSRLPASSCRTCCPSACSLHASIGTFSPSTGSAIICMLLRLSSRAHIRGGVGGRWRREANRLETGSSSSSSCSVVSSVRVLPCGIDCEVVYMVATKSAGIVTGLVHQRSVVSCQYSHGRWGSASPGMMSIRGRLFLGPSSGPSAISLDRFVALTRADAVALLFSDASTGKAALFPAPVSCLTA